MNAYLYRVKFSSLCTIGLLMVGGERFYSLELPWRNNARNKSCIPAGEYRCLYMARSSSGKYKNVYHVTGVTGRSGILIHNGNLPTHTKGCILLGGKSGVLGGITAVLGSRTAMKRFIRATNKQQFNLKVIEWNG